jgi:transcriptional regulator with XRE-family HTH domain
MDTFSAIADRLPGMTDAVAITVGSAVKSRRLGLGLTLEVLARGSGVSRAMLSDVERGNRSPTIKILSQIAMGLGCRVADLVDEPVPDRPQVIRAAQHAVVVDEISGVERRTLASPWLPPGIELVRYMLPAGARMTRGPAEVRYVGADGAASGPYPPNPLGSREHVTLELGRVRFDVGDEGADLRVGDTVAYRLTGDHTFQNQGRRPSRLAFLLDTSPARGA